MPGVARSYETATTANAVSTAADAALGVTSTDATAPGRLTNGTAALPQPLEVGADDGCLVEPVGGADTPLLNIGAPVSNDATTIGFRQSIAATTALRTGRYEKELRFTLSTNRRKRPRHCLARWRRSSHDRAAGLHAAPAA